VVLVCVFREEPTKCLPKEALERCAWIRPEEVPRYGSARLDWIRAAAAEERAKPTREALALLGELVEDPEEIRGELRKLALAAEGGAIGIDLVTSLCLDDGQRDFFRLLDGVCEGNVPQALRALEALRRRDDAVIPSASGLHGRMRLAWYGAVLPREGSRVGKALGAGFHAQRMADRAIRVYPREAIRDFVLAMTRINIFEKAGRGAGWGDLQMAVLSLLESAR
jgi:DNA polymerase III delta subunit